MCQKLPKISCGIRKKLSFPISPNLIESRMFSVFIFFVWSFMCSWVQADAEPLPFSLVWSLTSSMKGQIDWSLLCLTCYLQPVENIQSRSHACRTCSFCWRNFWQSSPNCCLKNEPCHVLLLILYNGHRDCCVSLYHPTREMQQANAVIVGISNVSYIMQNTSTYWQSSITFFVSNKGNTQRLVYIQV